MTFYPHWRSIVRKAWSIRFIALAGVLTGLELTLPNFSDDIPKDVFAVLAGVCCAAAFIARLVAQRDV